jgi:redox-sensitive bicupin YhaK (pirin superfamily)
MDDLANLETTSPLLAELPLGFQWPCLDPFLFCAHHDDAYPAGNAAQGPQASLEGRELGQDFEGKDGWRMYHGEVVPGFPAHPHRGFETVTLVRKGLIDHSDSLGAAARFGGGDVQWLTAGDGIQHSEMFPLVNPASPNPLELFQVWLNLPRASKAARPHFSMFWKERIPRFEARDAQGRLTKVTVVAGALGEARPLSPPPESWAANPGSDLAIWLVKLAPHAQWTLPAAHTGSNRVLYFFQGSELRVAGRAVSASRAVQVQADVAVPLEAGAETAELLLLQGRPMGEPVVQHGPFVGNSRSDIQKAFSDYQRTGFGGWKWGRTDPVHARDSGRFARYPDGHVERPA